MRDARPARLVVTGVIAAVVVAGAVLLATGGGASHRIYVTVPDATNLVKGQYLREGGQVVGQVGSITPASHGREVRLRFDIQDKAWPLPQGSSMLLRWGGTVSYDNRYVALTRGPASAPPLADGAQLAPKQFGAPVEFDQLLTAFTPPVQRDLRAMFRSGAGAFSAARVPLSRALVSAPPALEQVNGVIGDLHADLGALDTLVRSTAGVADAVQASNPGLGDLVSGAATTFDATASQATALQDTLARTPVTLANARRVLAHADTTLTNAGALSERLSPGVAEVRKIAAPLNHVLATVVQVGPNLTDTLATAHRATPTVNPLLDKATSLMPGITSIGTQSVDQLKCIRPYTPDILSFFTNWGDFLSSTDGRDKYIRATVQQLLPAANNVSTQTSADIAKTFPGLRYAFPRPPGYNAGQPWFLPQCGAGPDSLDPSKDPEATHFSKFDGAPSFQPAQPASRSTHR